MNEWTEIRRKVLVEHASKRSVMTEYGLGYRALEKILTHADPPGYRGAELRSKPKLGPFLEVIDQILEDDREAPAKQRHTAKRIFERLQREYGYPGGITQVQLAVARARRGKKEVFVPLSHPPGRAQFDFGEAVVEIAGERRKAAMGVMTLPYSDVYFVSAYPRECTETFQAAHVAAFEFFGAVPTKTDYDNTSIAVAKIVGRERELTASSSASSRTSSSTTASAGWGGETRRATSRTTSALSGATCWCRCRGSPPGRPATTTLPPAATQISFATSMASPAPRRAASPRT